MLRVYFGLLTFMFCTFSLEHTKSMLLIFDDIKGNFCGLFLFVRILRLKVVQNKYFHSPVCLLKGLLLYSAVVHSILFLMPYCCQRNMLIWSLCSMLHLFKPFPFWCHRTFKSVERKRIHKLSYVDGKIHLKMIGNVNSLEGIWSRIYLWTYSLLPLNLWKLLYTDKKLCLTSSRNVSYGISKSLSCSQFLSKWTLINFAGMHQMPEVTSQWLVLFHIYKADIIFSGFLFIFKWRKIFLTNKNIILVPKYNLFFSICT